MKIYNIQFEGYWLERNKAGVPAKSGVYLVYRSRYDSVSNTVALVEVIYIGQSLNVNQRIANHDRLPDFMKTLAEGETISYAYAPIATEDLDVVEKALIIAQKPALNEQIQSNINFSEMQFIVSGRCALLKYTNFTIS